MAKNETRIKDFFEGKRRRCSLDNFQVNRAKNDQYTVRLAVVMPLTNVELDGINNVFAEPFAIMNGQKSPHDFHKVNVAVDSAQFSIFTTDTQKRASIVSSAAALQDFKLIGAGAEDKRTVTLEFFAFVPGTEPLRDWIWTHLHKDFFVEVVPAQMELEEQEEEKPAKGKKNGKQLDLVQ
jgi:hypothetical protein